jgi:hypothetical protein
MDSSFFVSDKHPLPDNPAQITSVFLTPILQATNVLKQATITSITVEPLISMSSYNAQLARLHLTYDEYETGAPRSLIMKAPTLHTELHQNAAVFQPGLKECWFYRFGEVRTPLNVPHCYYNAVDSETGESFLLLEDLAPAQTGNQMTGASWEEAALALQSLAQLHAAWWGADLAAAPELAQLIDNSQEEQNLVDRLYQDAWPQFLEHATLTVTDDIQEFGESLIGRISTLDAFLVSSPQTLIHGDFRLDNMLFGIRHEQPTCWVIDWEDITLSNGMFDVAWFLGGGLPVEKSDREEELLRVYHQALIEAGVQGYTWAQSYHDYRCAMLSGFVQGILTITSLDTDNDYARNLVRVLTERFMMACRRLRLSELLP